MATITNNVVTNFTARDGISTTLGKGVARPGRSDFSGAPCILIRVAAAAFGKKNKYESFYRKQKEEQNASRKVFL